MSTATTSAAVVADELADIPTADIPRLTHLFPVDPERPDEIPTGPVRAACGYVKPPPHSPPPPPHRTCAACLTAVGPDAEIVR